MYEAINRRDVNAAIDFVDEDCLYEDLNFPEPFKGKAAVRKLFDESCTGIPDDLLFVADEVTGGGPGELTVGLTWHVELEGIPFPNGRGASFYRISEETGKLVYARDIVENPTKLGDAAFVIMRIVAPLVKKQFQSQKKAVATGASAVPTAEVSEELTEIGTSEKVTAAGLWVLAAVYWYVLLLSPTGQLLPGEPAYAVAPETLDEVIGESINFFLVLPLLNMAGIDFMQVRGSGAHCDYLLA